VYVAAFSLTDFRSYGSVQVELEPGVTAFVGANGQGKTNLVEAVNYLALLGSHRVATDAPLVRSGAEAAVIRARVIRDDRAATVEVEISPGRANRARLNRTSLTRTRDLIGVVRTVLFAPEDLGLVKGDPDTRRRFLDDLLVLRAPRLAGVRADYERVLRQRNALLKSAGATIKRGGGDLATLEVWDEHLAQAGAELTVARAELVVALTPHVTARYEQLAPDGGVARLEYRSSLAGGESADPLPGADREVVAAAMVVALRARRREELDRGVTVVGPHRDDLVLWLGDLPAKGYASHGESWSFALALRLASYALLRADGDDPILILDDVFAELDVARRHRLAELVADAEQVLITAAVDDDVPRALSGTRLRVHDGTVTSQPEQP
jgi:DNA replication and repair protein RecF